MPYVPHPSPRTDTRQAPVMLRRWAVVAAVAALAGAALSPSAQAQGGADWPNRSVQMVVPFPAGGPLDLVARSVGEKLAASLGQPFVVDNRAGATGNIGAAVVARAAPDGHTLLVTLGTSIAANPAVYPKMAFDAAKDLRAVSTLARFSLLLAVHPKTGIKEWTDFERSVRGTGFTYASAGAASPGHLAMAVLAHDLKAKPTHVPYRGNAPVVTDMIGGQVDSGFVALPGLLPHVKAGTLTPLAVSGSKRSPLLPEVPTIAERGYPDSEVDMTFVLLVPAGTPVAVVDRLNAEVRKALADADVVERLARVDIEPVGDTPAQAAERLARDTARWARVAKDAGIIVE